MLKRIEVGVGNPVRYQHGVCVCAREEGGIYTLILNGPGGI